MSAPVSDSSLKKKKKKTVAVNFLNARESRTRPHLCDDCVGCFSERVYPPPRGGAPYPSRHRTFHVSLPRTERSPSSGRAGSAGLMCPASAIRWEGTVRYGRKEQAREPRAMRNFVTAKVLTNARLVLDRRDRPWCVFLFSYLTVFFFFFCRVLIRRCRGVNN